MMQYLRATGKIQKGPSGEQTTIHSMTITASAAGTVTLTDGTLTYIIDTAAGINNKFAQPLTFTPDADVTVTLSGTASVFAEYTYK